MSTPTPWKKLGRSLFSLSWPNALTYLIQVTVQTGGILFVGRLGDPRYLGAAALGNMMAHLTGFSIGLGMTTALEALCSQAYGAKKYMLVGLHAQRACAILTLCCIPLALIWLQTATVLGWIGIEAETSELAGRWTRTLIVGMWPYLMFEALRRYLQGQRIVWPMVVSAAIASPINALLNYMFVYVANMGYLGAALATAITNWNLFFILIALINGRLYYRRRQRRLRAARRQYSQVDGIELEAVNRTSDNSISLSASFTIEESSNRSSSISVNDNINDNANINGESSDALPLVNVNINDSANVYDTNGLVTSDATNGVVGAPINTVIDEEEEIRAEQTWPSLSREIFRGWREFMVLGVPGSISLFLEWGSYEVSASIAGRLGTIPLAVHTVFMQTASVWYTIPLGFATGASTMIGNSLGSGNVHDALTLAKIGVAICALYGIINGAFFLVALRRPWVSLFTDDPDVVSAAYDQLPIMWLYGFWDATKAMTMMILRGTGRPQVTMVGNFLSCAIFAYPLAFYLAAKTDAGILGLWSCMSLAWLIATFLFSLIIYKTNWQVEVDKARKRNADHDNQVGNDNTNLLSHANGNATSDGIINSSSHDDIPSLDNVHIALPEDDQSVPSHSSLSKRNSIGNDNDYSSRTNGYPISNGVSLSSSPHSPSLSSSPSPSPSSSSFMSPSSPLRLVSDPPLISVGA